MHASTGTGVRKLCPAGHILSTTCLFTASEQRVVFTFFIITFNGHSLAGVAHLHILSVTMLPNYFSIKNGIREIILLGTI